MTIRKTVIFNNLLLWACSFVFFLFLFTEDVQPKTIDFIYAGSFLATIIPPVLVNFYILFPLFLKKERYFFYALTFIANILIFTQLNIWFFEHIIDYIFPDYYFISYSTYMNLLVIFSVFLIITTMINFSMDWFYFNRQENRELRIRNQQIETQLALLRSQINPHFLFNSLNVVYALAIENKAETKDAIVQLSDILRYVIYDSNTDRIALKDEITLLKNYIEFQQFRHQHSENITFNYSTDDDNYKIYPMLLLPLVENSFKYGIKGDIDHTFIKINLKLENNLFCFDIENNFSNTVEEVNHHSGVGLENIRNNLNIVYPKTHEFNIFKTEDTFKVSLKMYKK